MPIKFLLLGGGGGVVSFFGRGSAKLIFMGVGISFEGLSRRERQKRGKTYAGKIKSIAFGGHSFSMACS